MKTIQPYRLEHTAMQVLRLPIDYGIVNLQMINDIPTLFIFLDTDNETIPVLFNVCASGNIIEANDGSYRGSYSLGDAGFHVFEMSQTFLRSSPYGDNSVYQKYVQRSQPSQNFYEVRSAVWPEDGQKITIKENIKVDGVELVAGETLMFKGFDEMNRAANVGIKAMIEAGELVDSKAIFSEFQKRSDWGDLQNQCAPKLTPLRLDQLKKMLEFHKQCVCHHEKIHDIANDIQSYNEILKHNNFCSILDSLIKGI